ncbi:MAG: trypsin-like serine protease [Myxococcota bacterium]
MVSSKNHARLLWFLCGLGGLLGCSAAPSDEQPGESRAAISGGQPDAVNTNVFSLLVHAEEGVGACSSTLIAENLLLTARHCIAPNGADPVVCGKAEFGAPYPASSVIASNAVDVKRTAALDWYHGSEIIVPSEGNDTCGYDVALVILKERVPKTVAIPAVPRIDRPVERGEVYGAVGYGITETSEYGVRRLLGEREVQCEPGTCRSGVRANEFVGSSGPCEGDSGGPAFDVDGKVVGVDSRGTELCETPVYSTVTGWKDLIIETARHAAQVGGYEPPFWVTTGSSDPPPPPPPSANPVPIGGACDATSVCAAGGACYQPGDGSGAYCVALCKQTSDCSAGQQCLPVGDTVNACLAAPPSAKSSGCQMTPASSSAGFALAVAALALAAVRRRTRR